MLQINFRRLALIKEIANKRQGNLTIILENIIDPHNIGAVMRSCDSVGIREIFLLFTENSLMAKEFTIGKRSSAGTRKWVDVHLYTEIQSCFEHVKQNYGRVLSTHLDESACSLYELDLTQPTALLFGNERDGVSTEALNYSDGNFIIPQMGMAQSLNISVACAVSLFEALRQRQAAGFYHPNTNPWPAQERQALFEDYIGRKRAVLRETEQAKYTYKLPPK